MINWKGLGVPQYPYWIRNLASSDKETRSAAYKSLLNRPVPWAVTDPGMYWESLVEPIQQPALPFVVPFLVQLLEEKTVEDKASILWLLREIASYADISDLITEDQKNVYMEHALKLLSIVAEGENIYIELSKIESKDETQTQAQGLLNLLHALRKH